jgi:predicted ATPase/class 3 adenylate cyclase
MTNAFIPEDRRRALAAGAALPPRAEGSVLFADISGFTPLTEALAQQLGPRRGAEVLTRQLNTVYSALISAVEAANGSVIGFSGDAITCWFGNPAEGDTAASAVAAVNSAFAMQRAMAGFSRLTLPGAVAASLALKTAIVTGSASRLVVGDPAIQLIDVLAGGALDELADAEHAALQGDVVVDLPTLAALAAAHGFAPNAHVREWRTSAAGRRLGVLAPPPVMTLALEPVNQRLVEDSHSRLWVLPPVYERLHSEGGRFLAELRPATALFLQFGGLDFDHDPEAGAALDAFVRWVQSVVAAHAGAVIQLTTGDKGSYLYAAFGAPITHDDDMQRAVAAALSLRNPPPRLGAIRDIRIGISQGLMRVGPYGSDTRLTYGVLGDATNMAARLMTQAEVGQICVSSPIAAQVAPRFELAPLGLRRFKGKSEPQQVFAVQGMRTQLLTFGASPATPLLGRSAELAQLLALAGAAANGNGVLVRLEGEAGAGKSHLTSYFARAAGDSGLRIVSAACQSTAQNSAYYAAQQLVRSLLELQPLQASAAAGDQQAEIHQLEQALHAQDPRWLLRLPLLGDLLGLPIPENPTTAAFDARMRQEALAALLIEMIRRGAQAQPLLIVIEDAHWLDEASRFLILALARVVGTLPALLLLVQRPLGPDHESLAAALAEIPHQQRIWLAELDAEGTAQLARQRLGGAIDPLGLAFIHSLAQGNPFFTEELIDALIEGALLIEEAQHWRLSAALVDALRRGNCLEWTGAGWQLAPNAPLAAIDIGVPASIHGLVLSRLDRLPEENKLTLKVASVIGRVFELDLLALAHPGLPALEALAGQFQMLQKRDFARLESQKPRLIYVFKHNITQEVVYQTLLESQREDLHVAVAEAIESRAPDDVERLAHHYGQGDTTLPPVRAKAIHYIDAAGWRARKEHANETALAYFDRALQLEMRWGWLKGRAEVLHVLGRRMHEEATLVALEELGSNGPQHQMDTAILWASFYAATGQHRLAEEALQRALALALAQGDTHSEAHCYNERATISWRQGNYEAAEEGFVAALRLGTGSAELLDVESEAHYGLGLVYRQQSRYAGARQEFEQALAAAERLGDLRYTARALNALGSIAVLERDYLDGAELFTRALEIRETIGDRAGVGSSLMNLAQNYGYMGDYSRVEPLLLQALEIQQATRNRWEEMFVFNELGILYACVGQYAKAFLYFDQAMACSRQIESDTGAAYILCNLGQAQRDAGRPEAALTTLATGLQLARTQGEANLEAIYLSDLALANLYAHNWSTAVAEAQQSLALFTELDQPLSATVVYATLAAAELALGHTGAAGAAVHQALEILDGCGGDGPDFPQRDYWLCAQTLAALGATETAARARTAAANLLLLRAGRISDAAMRTSYLTEIAVHAGILAEVQPSQSRA